MLKPQAQTATTESQTPVAPTKVPEEKEPTAEEKPQTEVRIHSVRKEWRVHGDAGRGSSTTNRDSDR